MEFKVMCILHTTFVRGGRILMHQTNKDEEHFLPEDTKLMKGTWPGKKNTGSTLIPTCTCLGRSTSGGQKGPRCSSSIESWNMQCHSWNILFRLGYPGCVLLPISHFPLLSLLTGPLLLFVSLFFICFCFHVPSIKVATPWHLPLLYQWHPCYK